MLAAVFFSLSAQAYSYANVLHGRFLVEAGAYSSTQGQSQIVNINGLIGDRFNVTNRNDINGLVGVGYLLEGMSDNGFGFDYGINGFYLAKTKVSGTITQLLFTNLSYSYYVSHLPIYLFAKGFINFNSDNYALTADVGVGPNFMSTSLYADTSRDGITVPDNAFAGNFSQTVFSAMAGVGLKLNWMKKFPVEFGYRYFYLGEGSFNPRSSQILNKLKTGDNTAQALMLTISA